MAQHGELVCSVVLGDFSDRKDLNRESLDAKAPGTPGWMLQTSTDLEIR
jgi:hypothetical protein